MNHAKSCVKPAERHLEVQRDEFGEPFIGNEDVGEVPGVGAWHG